MRPSCHQLQHSLEEKLSYTCACSLHRRMTQQQHRNNNRCLNIQHCHTEQYKNSLFVQMAVGWNHPDNTTVHADSVNSFHSHCSQQELLNTGQPPPLCLCQIQQEPLNTGQPPPLCSCQIQQEPLNTGQPPPLCSCQIQQEPLNTGQPPPLCSCQIQQEPLNTGQPPPLCSCQIQQELLNTGQPPPLCLCQIPGCCNVFNRYRHMTSGGIPEHASIVFTTPATHLPGLVHEVMVGHHGWHHRQHAVVKVGDLEAIWHSLQLSHLVALTHLLMATQKPKVF